MATASTASAHDGLTVRGRVRIQTLDRSGRPVGPPQEWSNTITNGGRGVMGHVLGNDPGYVGAQYIAVGTGSAAPAVTDTAMSAELARAPLTQVSLSGTNPLTITLNIFLTASQANGTWTECGVFGNSATSASGSGTLMSRAAVSYVKDSSHQAVVSYTWTLA